MSFRQFKPDDLRERKNNYNGFTNKIYKFCRGGRGLFNNNEVCMRGVT